MKKPVTNKPDMYRRWEAGEFGNRIPYWSSVKAFLDDWRSGKWPLQRKVAIRYLEPGSPWCIMDISPLEIEDIAYKCLSEGADLDKIVVCCSDNDDHLRTLQGEVQRAPGGLYLYYSMSKKKMRDAFKVDQRHAQGLVAKLLLDRYMDGNSREWIDHLLDEYPDHVVEFTCLSRGTGDLGWNTIFWEVRTY